MDLRSEIVDDGRQRWRNAATLTVRAEVAAECDQSLQAASFWRRWLIRLHIEREVRRRMSALPRPSREALF